MAYTYEGLQQALQLTRNVQPRTIPQPSVPWWEKWNVLPTAGAIGGGLLGTVGGPATMIGGGAAGAGLGEILEQALTGKTNVKGIVGESVIGGAAPVVGKGIANIAGKTLGGLGFGLQRGVAGIKPGTLGTGIGAAGKEIEVTKGLRSLLPVGSAETKRRALKPTVEALGTKIKDLLGKKTIDASKAMTFINQQFAELPDEKAYNVLKESLIKRVTAITTNNKIPGQAFDALRMQVGKEYPKAIAQTPASFVKRAFYGALSDTVADTSEAARNLIAQQGMLYAAKKPLTTSALSQLKIPLTGIPVPGMGALQAGADITGRGLQGLGNLPARIPAPAGMAAAQIGARLPGALGGEGLPTQTEMGPSAAEQVSNISGTETTQQQPLISQQQAIDMIMANPELASAINTMYKIGQPAETSATGAGNEFLDRALQTISTIDQNQSLGYGPFEGGLKEFLGERLKGQWLEPKAIDLRQKYEVLRLNVLRAYQGARISDKDFEYATRYVPTIADTDQQARIKIQGLLQLLQTAQPPGPGEWTGTAAGGQASKIAGYSEYGANE